MSAGPAWRVEFDRDAARELRKLGTEAQRRILRYLRTRIATANDPRRFGKPLLGDLKDLWRYRVGDHRIVAKIEDDRFVVLVVGVGHRRNVCDISEPNLSPVIPEAERSEAIRDLVKRVELR